MAISLNCPSCHRTLTVSEAAPAMLTCPRCLGKVSNPTAGQMPVTPMRVIPIDEETHTDAKFARTLIAIALVIILVGVGLTIANSRAFGGMAAVMIVLVLVVLAGIWKIGTSAAPIPVTSDIELDRRGRTLEYRPATADRGRAIRAGPFLLGFFGSLAVCAACFILLGATVGSRGGGNAVYLLIVIAAVVGTCIGGMTLGGKPNWIGLRQGLATGMGLGMLALGPCAFCYLITMG